MFVSYVIYYQLCTNRDDMNSFLQCIVLLDSCVYPHIFLSTHGIVPVCSADVAGRNNQFHVWFMLQHHSCQDYKLEENKMVFVVVVLLNVEPAMLLPYGYVKSCAFRLQVPVYHYISTANSS